MSGIELAGLVLGAFPIALWGLEQYRDVAKQMGFWFQIRSEYQRSAEELAYHRLSFESNLKLLLLPVVDDDDLLEDMLSEPGGPAWKNAAIQEALETRLQKSYRLYLAILADMERVMKELSKELATENEHVQAKVGGSHSHDHKHEHNPSKESLQSPKAGRGRAAKFRQPFAQSNRDFQIFRAKFTFGEEKRKELFREFKEYNERLEKLTSTSDAISQAQANRQAANSAASAVNTALLKFWNHADRLYRIMVEAWNCTHDQHCAQLVLQHRTTAEKEFRLGLSSVNPGSPGSGSWATCAVRVKMLDRPEPQPMFLQATGKPPSSANGSPHLFNPNHKTKAPTKGALAPAIRTKKAHASVNSMTVTLLQKEDISEMEVPNTPKDNDHIQSLCSTLARDTTHSRCIGYMQDDDIRYYVYSDETSGPRESEVQLSQMLCGEIKPPLSRRQRYHLALTLASSFVQLKDSPWMQGSWGKECVYFARGDSDNVLCLDSPYITHNFNPSAALTISTGQKAGHDIVSGIASLGIILLELCFNSAIEHHPTRARLPPANEHTKSAFDLIAAMEWLKEVDGEAGSDYTEAVEWCISGCRTLPGDGSWRRAMVEKVVIPLEKATNTWKS